MSNFGIGVPPPIVSNNNIQQNNYFIPKQNNGYKKEGHEPLFNNEFVSPIAQIGINEAQKIVSNVKDNV